MAMYVAMELTSGTENCDAGSVTAAAFTGHFCDAILLALPLAGA